MKRKSILKWFILAIAIAINLFILINALMNGETSSKESSNVAEILASIINIFKHDAINQENFGTFVKYVRKIVGHFALFAFSGGFTTLAIYLFLKDTKFAYFLWQSLFTFVFGFSLALITEFAQTFVEGRSGAWGDVGIDIGGYFIGFFLVILILFLKKSPIFHRPENMKNEAK